VLRAIGVGSAGGGLQARIEPYISTVKIRKGVQAKHGFGNTGSSAAPGCGYPQIQVLPGAMKSERS